MGKDKAVTKAQEKEVSTNLAQGGLAGQLNDGDTYRSSLMVTNALSDAVKNEEAPQGVIINSSLPEDFLANRQLKWNGQEFPEKAMEFMPVGLLRYWVETDADTREFITKYPGNDANERQWEETVNGRNIKRSFVFSYLVILPHEIADGVEQVVEFPFRATAVKETKRLNSLIERLAAKKISSTQKVFKAKVVEKSNGKDKWYGVELGLSRDATAEEQACAESYLARFEEMKKKFMNARPETTVADESGRTASYSEKASGSYKVSDEELNSAQF